MGRVSDPPRDVSGETVVIEKVAAGRLLGVIAERK
jgi:hypothetical protein